MKGKLPANILQVKSFEVVMPFQIFSSCRHLLYRALLLFSLLVFINVTVKSQTNEDLSDVRVEELTDDQVRKFVSEIDRLGLRDDQVEQLAIERGMSPVEIARLRVRIQAARKVISSQNTTKPKPAGVTTDERRVQDSIGIAEQKPLSDFTGIFSELKAKNFGATVFNNPRLTFEPNLRLPTPKNYLLAADDELLIDVSGYSEASYRLKVSPEGVVRIPIAGPVSVNGLTIEQAKKMITRKLARTIYSDINTGRTFVEVTLGAIRSIKVTVIGEATLPGTYTLPSLASAYNALYACGGPNANGSFRNIQVVRNNATVATIDVYQYLLNGSKKNDIRLMDQDVIKISTYSVRIELKGEVKKPGLYDVVPGETLAQIVEYAGGFTDNAYTERLQVYSNTPKERQVSTIAGNSIENVIPHKGDTYIISKILNRFINRISVSGSVYRPGDYELKASMTLTQLIAEADGVREDAFLGRGIIHRIKDDLSPEIISFDLDRVMKKLDPDIVLQREDRVNIYSKFDLKEGYYVSIEGEVSSPGYFLYEDGMTVQDLVMMAGGLKESASMRRIEVSRRVKDADPKAANAQTALIFQRDVATDLRDSAGAGGFTLSPFDEVTVRTAPGYVVQKNAVIEGEVIYTGRYALEAKNDRISDLVKRAGGTTPAAYLRGAVLVRSRFFSVNDRSNYQQGISNLLKKNFESGTPLALLQQQYAETTEKTSDHVGIDLQKILDNPGSEYDLLLNDGDTLRIPRQLQTVRVSGEVLYPTLLRYDNRLDFKDYIYGAGGFSVRSSRKKSYVVYANGSVRGTRSFLFIKNYPDISPGAEIYIPTKRERQPLRTGEAIAIGATLVSMIAILFNALR